MFPARARRFPHPDKPGRFLTDAASLMCGDNVLHTTTVDAPFQGILERVAHTAVKRGQLDESQVKKGLRAAYVTPHGMLFVCLCVLDGSGLVLGTSVPRDQWRFRA